MHACSAMQRNASRGSAPALRCTVPVHCSCIPFVCALQCEHVCSACSACGSYDAHSACVVHAVCAAHAVRAAPVVPTVLEVHVVYEVLVQHVVDSIEVIGMTGIPPGHRHCRHCRPMYRSAHGHYGHVHRPMYSVWVCVLHTSVWTSYTDSMENGRYYRQVIDMDSRDIVDHDILGI